MKTALLSLLLFITACNSANIKSTDSGHEGDTSATDLNRVVEGVSAPDFTLESKDSGQITLSSYRDSKNVVLVFYRGYW